MVSPTKLNVPSPRAGAVSVDVTLPKPVFLYGYPKTPRISTAVNDPLLATALFLDDGTEKCLLISVDVIWLSKRQVAFVRERIAAHVDVEIQKILVAASHTHSGPTTVAMVSNERDPVVPPPDPEIVERILDGIVTSAIRAVREAEAAEVGFTHVKVSRIGGNRHNPRGPSAPMIPVMAIRLLNTKQLLAIHYVYSVHPTVLHEDSTLISGDFPGIARQILQQRMAGSRPLSILHHLGAAGNQSPRHAVSGNTLAEAGRLASMLADAIDTAVRGISFSHCWTIDCRWKSIDLPMRSLPGLSAAREQLKVAEASAAELKRAGADRAAFRTAECDLYGAEETVTLAIAAAEGKLQAAAGECLPAEIQTIRIGSRQFVAWPGEIFVEFAQELQRLFPEAVLITLANGELQGYLVTEEAIALSWYESANAIFASPDAGNLLIAATRELLAR